MLVLLANVLVIARLLRTLRLLAHSALAVLVLLVSRVYYHRLCPNMLSGVWNQQIKLSEVKKFDIWEDNGYSMDMVLINFCRCVHMREGLWRWTPPYRDRFHHSRMIWDFESFRQCWLSQTPHLRSVHTMGRWRRLRWCFLKTFIWGVASLEMVLWALGIPDLTLAVRTLCIFMKELVTNVVLSNSDIRVDS